MTPEPSGRYLRELLGVPFSEAQLDIATHPLTPQLVVAGAGSGKTAVLAARVVHLVAWHGVAPGAVLGLTFTNKAAGELADRVRTGLAARGSSTGSSTHSSTRTATGIGEPPYAERPYTGSPYAEPPYSEPADDELPTVTTYHAYAASLVADHALRIGREPATQLLTEASRWQLAGRVVRAADGPFVHLDWQTRTVVQYLLDLDAEMAEHLVTVADVRACDEALLSAVTGTPGAPATVRRIAAAAAAREELLDLVEAYRRRKAALDLLDFGDQVSIAAEIARRCPEVAGMQRERFPVVLLDEYQDTGVAQRVLLSALYGDGHPVTAVGDPCQSIYGWRGASVGNLLRFPEHFHRPGGDRCRPQFLMTNYRGGERLLRVANAVSGELRSPAAGARRPHLDVPLLHADPATVTPGMVVTALHRTVEEEATWVAEQVQRSIAEEQTAPGQVAVLCRRRADFPLLHAALADCGLPVEVVDLGGLLAMPEVADVVATLEVLADPTANAALVRLLTGPRWRLGARDLAALGRRAAGLAAVGADGPRRLDPDDPQAALNAAVAAIDPCDVVALADALDSPGDPGCYSPEAYQRLRALGFELARLRRLVAGPVIDVVAEVVQATGLDVEIEASPAHLATARAANLAAFVDHAARFVGVEGEADLSAFLDFLAAASEVERGLDVGAVSGADTVKLLTAHKAKGLEWDVVAVAGLSAGVFPSGQGRARWPTAAKVLPYRLRGDRDDLPPDPELSSTGLEQFAARCQAEDADEERRLAYVAITRARRRLIASGYRWGRTQVRPKDPAPFLLELRESCLAGAGEVDVWVEDPGPVNPLASAVVDVPWPAPYSEPGLAHRRQAAELVRSALADPAGVDEAALLAQLEPADQATAQAWAAEASLLLAELTAERAAVRDVPLPRSLTTSQVVRLAEDPGGLAASLVRPMPRRPSAAAARGVRFHGWVERLFDARPLLDEGDLPGAADTAVPADAELVALQEAFARSPYAGILPATVEAPFELVLGDRLVRGRIDAVYRTDAGFDVVDYKTGLRPRDPRSAALQLAVYRLAWAGITGVDPRDVGAAFLYVRTGELVRPDLPDRGALTRLLTGTA